MTNWHGIIILEPASLVYTFLSAGGPWAENRRRLQAFPGQAGQQDGQLQRPQPDHTIRHRRPLEPTRLQPLRYQDQAGAVIEEQLHPVRAARAEHEDIAGEWIEAQCDLHQGRQTVHAAAKIDRRRPDQHPDPGWRRDHRPSAASTRRKASPSTPRPTRTLTPSGRAISMRASTGAAPPASGSGTSAISTGRKCAAVSAGALPIQPPRPPTERLARQPM